MIHHDKFNNTASILDTDQQITLKLGALKLWIDYLVEHNVAVIRKLQGKDWVWGKCWITIDIRNGPLNFKDFNTWLHTSYFNAGYGD